MKALHCPSIPQPALIVFIDSENLNLNGLPSLFGCTKATFLPIVPSSVFSLSFFLPPLRGLQTNMSHETDENMAEISQRMIRLSISLLLSLRMKDLDDLMI